MQIIDRKNIEKRLLFYWGKMYNMSITSGKDYDKLEKCIVILISDYELKSLNEIKKYMTKWNLREEDYSNFVLTDVLEIYIIELPKFEKYQENSNSELDIWLKFMNNPEVLDMKEASPEVNKAKEVLEEISNDERERYLAELREKYIMDQKAIEDAGYDKGVEAGIQQGIELGQKSKTLIIAKKMKEKNIDINTISQITGLTIKEIQNLK